MVLEPGYSKPYAPGVRDDRTCSVPNDPRLICPVCAWTMIQVHGHLQCPACRYVEPCCW
jgi:hypothetical protein